VSKVSRATTRSGEAGAILVELTIVFMSFVAAFGLLITLIFPTMRRAQQSEQLFTSIDRGVSNPPYRLGEAAFPPLRARDLGQLQQNLWDHARDVARDVGRLSDPRLDFGSAPFAVCVRLWETRFNPATNQLETRLVSDAGQFAEAQSNLAVGARCTSNQALCNQMAVSNAAQNSEVSFTLTYDSPELDPANAAGALRTSGLPVCISSSNPSLIAGPTTGNLIAAAPGPVGGPVALPAGFFPPVGMQTCDGADNQSFAGTLLARILSFICRIITLGARCRRGC
jgi:hypothetical protein